jgi:predicted enzyme related to lactoylglutathione lyase
MLAAIVFHSSDPERLSAFYARTLGAGEPKRYGPTHLGLKLPNGYLGFEQGERPGGERITIWFGVEDVEEAYPRWLGLGGRAGSAPSREENAGEIIATLYDPDDNLIGLVCPAHPPVVRAKE